VLSAGQKVRLYAERTAAGTAGTTNGSSVASR
jgi:hypothetical protein